MSRFGDISYDSATENLSVGAGCLWDSVYHEIHKHGRNIVGAAIRGGVGVAGYLLGGGYSLKTNRFGLGIDNVTGFEIVLPDGRILDVSEEQEGDLFWALKVSPP
jgi:FAD/FMN-containing dehydrogenase